MTLQKYAGREGSSEFRPMTLAEAKAYTGSHIWVLDRQGSARRVKVNGAIRTWKRDLSRIEIPFKYGMYEYGTFTNSDIENGVLLVEVA